MKVTTENIDQFLSYLKTIDKGEIDIERCFMFGASVDFGDGLPTFVGLQPYGMVCLMPEWLALLSGTQGTTQGQRAINIFTAMATPRSVTTIKKIGKWIFGEDEEKAFREALVNPNSFAMPASDITGVEPGRALRARYIKLKTKRGYITIFESWGMGIKDLMNNVIGGKIWLPEVVEELHKIVRRNGYC
jgi:hypothetical protein